MADDASTHAITLGVADYLANQQDPVGPKLRDSLLYGVQQNPDTQAKAMSDARILNQPLDVTLSQTKEAAPQAQVERLNPADLMLHTPKTADWLSQPHNAAVAHDDINVLGQIEQTLKNLGQLGKASFWGAVSGAAGALQGASPLLSGLGVDLGDEKSGMGEALKIMRQGGKTLSAADMPQTDNNWQAGINSGVVSLFQAAPSIAVALATRNPGLMLGAAGAIQGGQSYGDARDAGKSRGVATAAGGIEGGIEIGTELAPVHALYSDFLKKTGLLTTMLHQVVPELVGEQLATLGQNFTDWALIHPELPFSTFLSQIPDAAVQTAIATGVGIGAHASLSQVVQAATTHIDRQTVKTAQAAHAEQTGQVLDGLMKSAQTSALRERDPQTFKEYVDHVTQDSPVDRVYVNAQDLVDTIAGGSAETLAQDAQVLQAMPSVIPQLDEAVKSGGLVEIPVSELLAYAPDTHLGQALVEHLKVDPEGFSMKEAETFMQSQKDSFKADVQKAMEDHGAGDEYAASAERVRQTIKAQLDQANRFTPDVNEAYSHLPASFFAATAAKIGMTPEEMYARHPLTVQAQGVTEGSLTQDPAAKAITETPEFKGWFGDSQVRGQDGQPLVVYHGTNQPIGSFAEERLGQSTKSESSRLGYFFTTSPSVASQYAEQAGKVQVADAVAHEAKVAELKTKVDRLEKTAQRTGAWDAYEQAMQEWEDAEIGAMREDHITGQNVVPTFLKLENPKTIDLAGGSLPTTFAEQIAQAKAEGHDGVILKNIADPPPEVSDHYVVFKPEQIKSIFNRGTFDPADPNILHQTPSHFAYDPGLGFQSTLFSTVANAKQAKASGDQWLAMIQNTPGVKKEELEWIGLPEALAVMGAQGAISREQILAYIAQNGVRLEEVVQAGEAPTQDEIRSRAVDLAMQQDELDQEGLTEEELEDWSSDNTWHDFADAAEQELREESGVDSEPSFAEYQAIPGGENYRELLLIMPKDNYNFETTNHRLTRNFTAGMGHWDHDNVLAHTRLADFTTPDGKRVLGVLEIQSDWHQKGRDKGYAVAASPEEQAAANLAWHQAKDTRDTLGGSLIDVLPQLMRDRLAELEAQRLDFHSRAKSHGDRAVALRATGPASEVMEAERNFADLRRKGEQAADTINQVKSALNILHRQGTASEVPRDDAMFGHAARIVGNSTLWRGTDLAEQYGEAFQIADALRDAQLKAQEADQRLQRAQGQAGIPDAPFKATWPALVMKRLIKEAVEKGYDHIAWATGEQQIAIYPGLEEQVGDLGAMPAEDPEKVKISVSNRSAERVIEQRFNGLELTREQAIELFGAGLGNAVFEKGRAADPSFGWAMMDAGDFAVGGEGQKAFYNRNLVNITNDIIKKFGAKVGVVELNRAGLQELDARIATLEHVIVEGAERSRERGTPEVEIRQMTAMREEELARLRAERKLNQQLGFPITDKMRAEDKAVSPPLFQAADTTARGSFNPQTSTITLLRGADLSTFLHETGHFFLETLAKLAADEHAPQEIKDDWAKASQFIGFGGVEPAAWLSIPVDARRDSHETFARGFEAYLREGRAPAPQLKGVFQRFKSWLVHVYQSAAQLNVELTPEVRGVMDRLIASQTDIARAEQARNFTPVFDTKPEGMTNQEWEAYQRLGAEATADAEDTLQARSIRDMQWLQGQRSRLISRLTREAREKRQAVRAEVESEVAAEPIYAAQALLKRGTINGETVEGPHKLGLPELRKMYGAAPTALEEATGQKLLEVDYRKLGYGKYGMLAEEGLDPNHVAELFGFSSGDELVRTLLTAEPVKTKVEGITDQRMLERYGDLTDPQAIAKAADEAIHNDARLRFVATEANALAKAAGRTRVLAEAARDFARELVGRTTIRNLKPGKYTGAEARAANASAKAFAKGDLVEAATEKRNQLINGYAAKAAYAAQEEVEKALRLFARLDGEGARKALSHEYRDQIDQLLERFDLRRGQSLKAIDKRTSLVKWYEASKANGLEPVIPDELLNEALRKSYKDLSLDELRGLRDSVLNIAHLGRLKNRLLAAKKARDFAATVEDATGEVERSAIGKPRDLVESNQLSDKAMRGLRGYAVTHRKFDSLIHRLGGFKANTTLWNVLVRPKNDAQDREASMIDASTRRLHAIFTPILADQMRAKLFIPELGRSLSLEGRLAVALNLGNEINRKRIMDGDNWTPAQLDAILRTLEPRHLTFVQEMWDHINSFRPQIEAKELRLNGVAPEFVDPTPFSVTAADGSTIEMRGGYYPIDYDPDRSAKAAEFDALKMAKQAVMGAGRGYTKPGHLKARVDEVKGRPVRKSLGVAFRHLTDVVHDLAWHEYIVDAKRLLGNDTLANSIRVHAGPEILRSLKKAVDAMEVGDTPAQNGFEASVNYLRSGATVAGLAWNFLTALQQPLGLLNGTARIGPKWMGAGLKRWIGDAATMENTVAWVHAKSEFMHLRANATTLSRELHDVRGKLRTGLVSDTLKATVGGPAAVKVDQAAGAAEGSFYYVIGKMQMVADIPTWLGQYEKSMSVDADEDKAIAMADQAVRDSQGAGQIGDLSEIQRGGPLMKLWTNFYSYFNVVFNQLVESVEETQLKGVSNVPAMAADFLLIMILPSLFGNMLKKLVTGDDDWASWPKDLALGLVGDLFGMMVGLRDIGAAVLDGKSAPAGMRILQNTALLAGKVKHGTFDAGFWKAVNSEGGILFHYPAAQVQRTAMGFQALADGSSHNPLALVVGPKPKPRSY